MKSEPDRILSPEGTVSQGKGRAGNVAARVALSAAAIAFFGSLGWSVWVVRPLEALEALACVRPVMGWRGGAGVLPGVPAPPGSELAFRSVRQSGAFWGYRSRLGQAELWDFYAKRMPRLGWKHDTVFEKVRHEHLPSERLLAFRRGEALCIIGLRQHDDGSSAVTVLLLAGAGTRGER